MNEEKKSIRARIMLVVSGIVYRFYPWVLAACVLLSVFAYFSYKHLELKLNFTDMLSEDDPAVVQYRHAVEQFGALSFLFIVVESDDLDRTKEYADALAEKLVEDPSYVPAVYHKIEIQKYLSDALLFLEPKELNMLADLFSKNKERIADLALDPGLTNTVRTVDESLASYVSGGQVPDLAVEEVDFGMVFGPMQQLIRSFEDYAINGPAGQSEKLKKMFADRIMSGASDMTFDLSEPYLVASDDRHLLMLVSSTKPAEDFEWCSEFMEYVEGQIDELEGEFPDVPDPKITGNAAVMRDDNRVIRHDMKVTTLVAFIGIMLLFAFSFRNLSSILIVGVPLMVGILWALGGAYWTVGYLTPVTAIFGAILLGLGIDYAILILSRYTEERHAGRGIKESLDTTMSETGVSILTGAMATALAFFSLTQAAFKGGQEMGIIAGTGIVLFVLIMTFGLGSLLVAWDKRAETRGPTQKKFDPKMMKRIASLVDKKGVWVFVVLAAVVGFMAYMAPRYKFEYNYLNLEPQGVESIELIHKIPEWFGIDTNYGMIISDSLEEDRRLAAALRGKPTVSRVEAISDFIPTSQEAKLLTIEDIRESLPEEVPPVPEKNEDPAAMTQEEFDNLITALKSLRDTIGAPGRGLVGIFYLAELEEAEFAARDMLEEMDSLIESLQTAPRDEALKNLGSLDADVRRGLAKGFQELIRMASTEGVTLETMKEKHPELIERFQGKDGSFMIYSYPSVVIWEEQNLKAVANDLREVDPDAMGVAILFDQILKKIKDDLVRIALIALSVVFVVIFLNYRGIVHTVLTLVPLVAGAITMVGVMNIIGLKFNIINTGMLPLVIGIGVDYGVYVVHRWVGEGKGLDSIRPVVESTGRAVTLSALTTMIGFASIMLAQWRGLMLMGGTLTMGIGFCWIGAILLLPSILKTIEIIKARRSPD